jgi:hypothetical protein
MSVSDIDLPFANVVACYKECGLRVVALEDIKDMGSEVLVWAIIICNCDGSMFLALEDVRSIGNISNLSTRNGRCVGSFGSLVLRAGWTKLVVTPRRVTVLL